MKKYLLLIFLLIMSPYLKAQQCLININFKDGSSSSISFSEISDIYFDNLSSKVLNDPHNQKIVKSLQLFQNYPNPFNSTTTIQYSLPQSGDVLLEIFNISGQIVKSYHLANQESGEHSIKWDGTNEKGVTVSSGVYFYTLRINDEITSRRMLHLK